MTALLPVNISFVEWANQLRSSFPTENILIVNKESDWLGFPSMLLSNRCFDGKVIPHIGGFNSWQQWASEFMLSIGA